MINTDTTLDIVDRLDALRRRVELIELALTEQDARRGFEGLRDFVIETIEVIRDLSNEIHPPRVAQSTDPAAETRA